MQIPFDEIRSWMFDKALPFWAEAGMDSRGGFVEAVDFKGRPAPLPFKRTRVACRQTYVFAHAAELGWAPGLEISRRGAEFIESLRLGPSEGWPRRLSPDNTALDATPDLYDLAFVLFAFAWRFRASRDPDALAGAHRVLDFIDKRMRASQGGFWHELPPQGWRLQNPHMHLLEASLVAFEASRDSRFLDLATELVGLFASRFFDGRTLAEYFTEDLVRAPVDKGREVEPGHQLEWAWILTQFQRLTGGQVAPLATQLVDFAERFGVDPASHVTFQLVRDDGTALDKGSRTWPNTERIKGHLALFEAVHRDPRAAVAGSARLLLDRYLATDVPGLWIDHFDAHGAPIAKDVPSSTLYHVFLAFAEILRLEGKIRALDGTAALT
jgi:N-acylglucosamine 2-epimerase/mannose-6-phosphate isomerase